MANTFVNYTGNGSTTAYNVPFPFIDRTHVLAYLDGVQTTAFTWVNDGQINMDAPVGSGVVLNIRRVTPSEPFIDFTSKSRWQTEDLNLANRQALYKAEEAADYSNAEMFALIEAFANSANADAATASAAAASAVDAANIATSAAGVRDVIDYVTLEANTALTYSGSGANTVTAGQVIRTRAEGFSYTVAASGASDHHVSTAGGVKLYVNVGPNGFNVKAFGAKGDNSTDDTAAIVKSIAVAAAAVSGSTGSVVNFPTGTYLINTTINLPNRVGIQGANGRGTTIKPHSSFSASYMFDANNGTTSMFGSWIRDVFIDARGKNMTAAVWSRAWQETCGMERCLIYIDGTTQYGFRYTNGYGGASYLVFQDNEIFSDSTNVNATGVYIDQISSVGGFVFKWTGGSIIGSTTNPLPAGITMVNDTLVVDTLHSEFISTMINMRGVGSLSANGITGSFNNVTDIITLGSTFTGQVSLRSIIPNGASGNIVKDNTASARNIPASAGMLPSYDRDFTGFAAEVATRVATATGTGNEYTVLFDNELYDYRAEYDPTTGIFTAKRAGKYLFTVALKVTAPLSVTTFLLKLAATGRTHIIYRGDTDNIRDGSSFVTLNGAFIVNMGANDTAKVTVTASGLASNTIAIETTESHFSAQWLNR